MEILKHNFFWQCDQCEHVMDQEYLDYILSIYLPQVIEDKGPYSDLKTFNNSKVQKLIIGSMG